MISIAAFCSASPTGTISKGMLFTMDKNCKPFGMSYRLRNQPCPSATTNEVVIRRGRISKSAAKESAMTV